MTKTSNLKIRQRILAEGKRRNFIASLKNKSPKRNSSQKEQTIKGGLGNVIDYKNTTLLRRHISTQGRILPRRVTGLTAKQQRQLAKSVKRARQMCLVAIVRRRGGQK
uniref:Small ribosomal subunit protein bS18c n=1 Tax=Chloropicon mariensis TaxID=1606511 RepID=A0A4D6C2G5_9CHLO|nr:ribosomal protein S18 [Chloropicon mariensis]QBX97870.1 ribosomal protein S18 [Chloropicon mariensis]UQK95296.1 ribosomal protein S18 [Chloropicon mariensis]